MFRVGVEVEDGLNEMVEVETRMTLNENVNQAEVR